MKNFKYKNGNKIETIKVKPVSVFSLGLMFKSKSPALLFELSREKKFSIHSFFCKPFETIWLDKNKKVVKKINIKNWGFFSGRGKYLLEIPFRR